MSNETFIYMGGDTVVPPEVIRVQVHPSVTVIPEKAFSGRKKLEEIILCEGLQEIGSYTFSHCSVLNRIDIPASVNIIHDHAFYYSSKLEEVNLYEGLQEIGTYAFSGCKRLKTIKIPTTVTVVCNNTFSFCHKLERVELCEGLLEIRENAFICCTSLTQIKVPLTVSIIGKGAFKECKLKTVELREGLVEIGDGAFYNCWFEEVNIPSTVKKIDSWAFCHVPLESLSLPDGIESIGDHAFCNGAFTMVRVPPLVTAITQNVCRSSGIFSMELPESTSRIDDMAFDFCASLRNIALQPNTEIGFDVFKNCVDLKQLGSERNIINALKHRFENLPIHKMLYYQSYDRVRVLRSKLDDPTMKQQDALGMTPLHILACSSLQNLELYRVLIQKYPESLVTQDRWGALPLLYAVWGSAPSEIVQFLVQSYQTIFPNYQLKWTMMFETLGRANVSSDIMHVLRKMQHNKFPDQHIDWDTIVENAITLSNPDCPKYRSTHTFRNFLILSMSDRACAIRNKALFEELVEAVNKDISDGTQGRRDFMRNVHQTFEM